MYVSYIHINMYTKEKNFHTLMSTIPQGEMKKIKVMTRVLGKKFGEN